MLWWSDEIFILLQIIKMEEKRTYFVANCDGVIAGHDLSYTEAQAVLDRELQKDENNEQEREIINTEDEE